MPITRTCAVSGVIAALAIIFLIYHWNQSHQAQETIIGVGRERDEIHAKLAAAEKKLAEATKSAAEAQRHAATMKEDISRLFSKENTATLRLAAEEKAKSRFRINTKAKVQLQTATRRIASVRSLETTYPVLYRRLKLTPEQIDRFKLLAVADAKRFAALDEMAKRKGMSPTHPEIQPLYLEAEKDFRTKVTEYFGAEAIPIIEHFAETLFLRDGILQVANELYWTDTPLTEPQANLLVEIVWKNMRDSSGRIHHLYADPEAMKSDAKRVLSGPQHAVWCAYIDYHAETSFVEARINPFGLGK